MVPRLFTYKKMKNRRNKQCVGFDTLFWAVFAVLPIYGTS